MSTEPIGVHIGLRIGRKFFIGFVVSSGTEDEVIQVGFQFGPAFLGFYIGEH